jgi:hypothetical protein
MLLGDEFTQEQLRDAMYTLYEPEVQTAEHLFTSLKTTQKIHKKKFKKFVGNYLLDVLELNEKARTVFYWSGKS